MIRLEGNAHPLCRGISRRDVLRIGALGIGGFALADLLRLQAEAGTLPSTQAARSIIMIHLNGGPSHVDTWDPKPDAPAEIRGEFKAIDTNVAGIRICEHFPLQAQRMDRLALIRSVYGGPDDHSSSHTVTGYSNIERRTQDRPSLGSVVSLVKHRTDQLVPSYVSLRGVGMTTGLGPGYLNAAYGPLSTSGPGREDLRLRVSERRLDTRRKLLERLDRWRQDVESGQVDAQDAYARQALQIVSSSAAYDALNVNKEPQAVRQRYGNDQFVLARRLVEAGVQCVALETGGWDTHSGNFTSLKQSLMPRLDKAFCALLDDLKDRGLLQETVVVMWGEFGRTPRVNRTAGRDHWTRVMSAVVAGGGLRTGQVVGSSDEQASYPDQRPCKIRSVLATLYAALGIDPHSTVTSTAGRPMPLIDDADPITELLA